MVTCHQCLPRPGRELLSTSFKAVQAPGVTRADQLPFWANRECPMEVISSNTMDPSGRLF